MVRGEEDSSTSFFRCCCFSSDASAPLESVLLQQSILTDLFLRSLFLPLQPIQIILGFWTFFRVLGIIYEFHPSCLVLICDVFSREKIRIRWDYRRGEFFGTPPHAKDSL